MKNSLSLEYVPHKLALNPIISGCCYYVYRLEWQITMSNKSDSGHKLKWKKLETVRLRYFITVQCSRFLPW